MRDFRGLTKDGKWVYGYYIVLGSHHLIADEGTDWDSAGEPGVIKIEGLIEVIPKTVGQQVGLKDKNGKEIYEGDIVSSGFWGGTVEFIKGAFKIVQGGCAYSSNFDVVKIIGNIHL